LYLTGTYPELEKLKLDLLGQEKDNDENIVQVGSPLCNQEGALKLVGLVGSLANKHGILTHQDEFRISKMMKGFSKTVRGELMLRAVSWGFDRMDRNTILEMTTDLAFLAIQRGFHGGDRRFWKGTQQDIHTSNDAPQQKTGMFSRMAPWK